ncbi:MAG: hypothetical protein NTY77_00365 [Elusimicrobia bacterium]|nr:hypothetical protein [Elusimicrobiota bacterium]
MDRIKISGGLPLRGRLRPPADETLAHTALLLGAMAGGHTVLERLPPSLDVHCTCSCLTELGVTITPSPDGEQTAVRGLGWRGLAQPKHCLKAGDSVATASLLMGVIAANPIAADISGEEGLQRVSLSEVAVALRKMGASIHLHGPGDTVPVCVLGRALKAARHVMQRPCGHLKAAVLLAGTMSIGETSVAEPFPSDPRLEGLLALFGAEVRSAGFTCTVLGGRNLAGTRLAVPPDFSWAAFWALAAGLAAGGEIFIEGLTPQDASTGVLGALCRMGLRADWHAAGLRVRRLRLCGADLPWQEASADPALLAVAASQAEGASRLRGAAGDSPERLIKLLDGFGVRAEAEGKDLVVSGPTGLRPGRVAADEELQLARAGILAGILADGETTVSQTGVLSDRYPALLKDLSRLRG